MDFNEEHQNEQFQQNQHHSKNFTNQNVNLGNHDATLNKEIDSHSQLNVYENDDAYLLDDNTQGVIEDKDLINQHEEVADNPNNEEYNNENDNYEEMGDIDGVHGDYQQQDAQYNSNQNLEINNPEDDNNERSHINLLKLQYISVCQACKEPFNSTVNVPFMLKCGHFFCRNCILTLFSDDEGRIFCPEDQDVVSNGLNELKLLNNLINEDVNESNNFNNEADDKLRKAASYCPKHPTQKLSHIVEQTQDVLCVNCAFQAFKSNPKMDIKEISELCGELLEDVNKILENNQYYVEILQNTLKEIKDNKSQEEKRVINFYDELILYLEQKKEEYIDQVNSVFSTNADKLGEKLDNFSQKMEEAENFKTALTQIMNNQDNAYQITELLIRYNSFLNPTENENNKLDLIEYNFYHENDSKLSKFLNSSTELKQKQKIVRFIPKNNIQSKSSVDVNAGKQIIVQQQEHLSSNSSVNNPISITNLSNKLNSLTSNSIKNENKTYIKEESNYDGNQLANNDTRNINLVNKNNIPKLNSQKDPIIFQNSHIQNKQDVNNEVKYNEKNSEKPNYTLNTNSSNFRNNSQKIQSTSISNSNPVNLEKEVSTMKLDPSSIVKSNYDIIKANNSNHASTTNSHKNSHLASVTIKKDYPLSAYSKDVLNTDELLKENKEVKNRNNMKPNNLNNVGNSANSYIIDPQESNPGKYGYSGYKNNNLNHGNEKLLGYYGNEYENNYTTSNKSKDINTTYNNPYNQYYSVNRNNQYDIQKNDVSNNVKYGNAYSSLNRYFNNINSNYRDNSKDYYNQTYNYQVGVSSIGRTKK